MQIVIDIPDYIYCDIQAYKTIFPDKIEEVAKAIQNGTPLPDCHGRLIDADKEAKLRQKARIRMNKLNTTISNVAYILDCLMTLRNIYETGDCNVCANKKVCKYVPKPGQMVRYNCPFYKAESDGEE